MKVIFSNKRLTSSNIQSYIAEMYPNLSIKKEESKIISSIPALLQKEYGEDNDCTLTSLTALLMFLTRETNANKIYSIVEKIAKQYGYNGKAGTNPFFIKKIFDNILKSLSIRKTSKAKYLKCCGYNFTLIKQLINNNRTPIILSLNTDGRNYYKNHSVLIIGYKEFLLSDNKLKRFLVIQDNWKKEKSFIDYDKLSVISSINY